MSATRRRLSQQPRTGIVVELCGLPGAGKTTIAVALAEYLRCRGIDAFIADRRVSAVAPLLPRLAHKAVSVGAVVLAGPLTEGRTARVLGRGQTRTRDRVAVPVHWWTRKRVLALSSRTTGVAILEEGLVQALWSAGLRSSGTPLPTMVDLAGSAARPDVVVHVDVPPGLAVDRLTSRVSTHSRVQGLPVADRLPAMRSGDVLLHAVLDEWRRRELSDVVVIDGAAGDPTGPLAAEIISRWQLGTPRSD